MESLPAIHWQGLNKGQQNPREEEEICWPHFKDWLKKHLMIFSSGLICVQGNSEKGEFIFPKGSFCSSVEPKEATNTALTSAIYFPRRAVFNAG